MMMMKVIIASELRQTVSILYRGARPPQLSRKTTGVKTDVVLMLGQLRKRWANIKTTLAQLTCLFV